ncbi:hypothetical protein [Dickeya dadantii]|uniref:Uncharacterized protein n=1 Tax=Dickeya dadantii (strain 3937) TaxID=198628 RepID=E0SHN7_DICD3|nr:hypothetical protein [Dickeya dadantii]ADM97802.1 hypothetical protein Dda3937_04085 [Dickeya dadantii 3937]UAY97740.1 hypothetical protein KTF62_07680 [Dickeya dadantii]
MAKVKSKTVSKTPATTKVVVSARVENGTKPQSLTLDDFTSEYREVVKELLALKRKNAAGEATLDDATHENVVEQAVMRVVHVGQKQHIAPAKVRQMIASGSESARNQRSWQPQKALERRSGMLAGSSRLRKIG